MTSQKSPRGVAAMLTALFALSSLAAPLVAQTPVALDTEESKTLYAMGLAMSQSLQVFNLTSEELEFVQEGLADGLLGREIRVSLQEYSPKVQAFARQRQSAAAGTEKAQGASFLEQKATEDGAVRTESGLVITEITAGTGATPMATDRVSVHYHGTLRDGTVFDSSVDRGEPAQVALNQVVPCWTEGLQLMKVGGKSLLVCPSDLAYGDQGRPPGIPPGAVLVFEVELLEIVASDSSP